MTERSGRLWTAVSSAIASAAPPEHLATEAVAAYVDGELSITAEQRASRHLAGCSLCTAEVAAQHQARAAVRGAEAPTMPPSLLAALHAIPLSADLPPGPDALSISEDGQFVVAQRPLDGAAPLGLGSPLGSSARIGSGARIGSASTGWAARRVRQGAGVVVSGLVLGALTLAVPGDPVPGSPRQGAEPGSVPVSAVPARFEFVEPDRGVEQRDDQPAVAGRPQR